MYIQSFITSLKFLIYIKATDLLINIYMIMFLLDFTFLNIQMCVCVCVYAIIHLVYFLYMLIIYGKVIQFILC